MESKPGITTSWFPLALLLSVVLWLVVIAVLRVFLF